MQKKRKEPNAGPFAHSQATHVAPALVLQHISPKQGHDTNYKKTLLYSCSSTYIVQILYMPVWLSKKNKNSEEKSQECGIADNKTRTDAKYKISLSLSKDKSTRNMTSPC